MCGSPAVVGYIHVLRWPQSLLRRQKSPGLFSFLSFNLGALLPTAYSAGNAAAADESQNKRRGRWGLHAGLLPAQLCHPWQPGAGRIVVDAREQENRWHGENGGLLLPRRSVQSQGVPKSHMATFIWACLQLPLSRSSSSACNMRGACLGSPSSLNAGAG